MRLLVLGCGAIGAAVAEAAVRLDGVAAVHLWDVRPEAAHALAARLPGTRAHAALADALPHCDLVVECASQEAVRDHGEAVLAAGRDLVLLSVGALADDALRARLVAAARAAGRTIHVPSGAVAGLDALQAAAGAELDEVVLTTAKPPAGFDLPAGGGPVTLFEGTAREAVARFPKNVNVAATLALAGVGLDATRVRVVADPSLARNTHTVRARGAFGEVEVRVANEPFPHNPRTSWLAALSAIALLRKLVSPLRLGT